MRACTVCLKEKPDEEFPSYKVANKRLRRYACKVCTNLRNIEYSRKARKRPEFVVHLRERQKERRRELRHEFFTRYGGKCNCCGLDDYRFLSIDHVNGDGWKDRKLSKRTISIIASIRRAGWPTLEDYQILCYNCNLAKEFTKMNVCPHQIDAAMDKKFEASKK